MEWLAQYGYILFGIGLVVVYFLAIFVFLKRHSIHDDKKVSIGWHLLLGPFALIKWHAQKTGKKELVARREMLGWALVLALIFIIAIWKITSKSL